MAAAVLTKPKHTRFTVRNEMIGIHTRPDGTARAEPPRRGELVTREEIGHVGADLDRLVGLRAIEPLVLTIDQLADPDPAVPPAPLPADPLTSVAKWSPKAGNRG
jgi:hypothetical protein